MVKKGKLKKKKTNLIFAELDLFKQVMFPNYI